MKAITIALAGLFCLMLTLNVTAEENELSRLKARFKARYPTLTTLKNAGKIGETHQGNAAPVKAAYLEEKAVGEKTVKTFLAEENKDRSRLYVLMAKQAETTPQKVAQRAAKRNFGKAAPEHYLKLKSGKWIKKKDYKPDPQ